MGTELTKRYTNVSYYIEMPRATAHNYMILYSQKIWRGIKFGSLAICLRNCQIKIRQYFILVYTRMAIPHWTAKFKSANIFSMAIWGPTAKFNSCQHFLLYGMLHDHVNARSAYLTYKEA